jgi:hypothetical protein
MTQKLLAFLLVAVPVFMFAQEETPKYALVIGNGSYTGSLGRLANPVNDANDVAAVLAGLGFTVDKVLDGSLSQMDDAVIRLKDRLGKSAGSYGFFFYAGHGVQSNGENYLIPVDAVIPNENRLRDRAVSMQAVLDDLNDAHNSLNVVVLDACRDNPFGWGRGGGRGLAMVSRQPAGSIIVYATSAGQQASDGEGRNGLFTGRLLGNLADPALEVKEVFNRTGADVAQESLNRQIPAVYSQFFGTAYLGAAPDTAGGPARPLPPVYTPPAAAGGPDSGRLWAAGASLGSSFSAPWLIGTVHGTLAPFRYSFMEIGVDFGFASGDAGVGYYSIYPFAHYAFYMPAWQGRLGLYAGAGGGYMIAQYSFPGAEHPLRLFAFDLTAGIRFTGGLTVSYTLRTDFATASNKFAVGYLYRF